MTVETLDITDDTTFLMALNALADDLYSEANAVIALIDERTKVVGEPDLADLRMKCGWVKDSITFSFKKIAHEMGLSTSSRTFQRSRPNRRLAMFLASHPHGRDGA